MRTFLLLTLMFGLIVSGVYAQEQQTQTTTIPDVKVKNMNGENVQTASWRTDELVVVSFWATWCKPCLVELQTYADLYQEWKEKTGVRVIAVSIDDSRNARKVPAFVKGRNWPFEVVLDENSDLKRAMNVNNVPHTFILQNGQVVWQHSAFAPGDEDDVEHELLARASQKN